MSTVREPQNESEVRSMRGGDDHPEPDNMMPDRYRALQRHLHGRISSSIDSIRVDCLGVFTAAARRHPHVDEFAGFLLSVQEVEILRSGSWSIDRWGRIHADSSRRTEQRQRSHVLW